MLAPVETSPDCRGALQLPASRGSAPASVSLSAPSRSGSGPCGAQVTGQAPPGNLMFGLGKPREAFSPGTRKSD